MLAQHRRVRFLADFCSSSSWMSGVEIITVSFLTLTPTCRLSNWFITLLKLSLLQLAQLNFSRIPLPLSWARAIHLSLLMGLGMDTFQRCPVFNIMDCYSLSSGWQNVEYGVGHLTFITPFSLKSNPLIKFSVIVIDWKLAFGADRKTSLQLFLCFWLLKLL